jgi:hypothetical protein
MPTTLIPPIYSASRDGLVSKYNKVGFTGDLNMVLPLYGTFQGDPVKAISVYIDNYNNAIPVNYLVSGTTGFIAPYTSQFIDVSRSDELILSAASTIAINLEVHDNPQSGGQSRGLPPNGASDPMWSNVLGLWHFDGTNGDAIAVDSKVSGAYIGPVNVPIISNSNSLFGGTSMHLLGPAVTGLIETYNPGPISGQYTFEFSVYPVSIGSGVIIGLGEVLGSVAGSLIFTYQKDPASNNLRFVVTRETNGQADVDLIATNYIYPAGAWYSIALTNLGQLKLYVNGVGGSTALPTVKSLQGIIFNNGSGIELYVDEIRLTLGTRYTSNYTVATIPFPNQ